MLESVSAQMRTYFKSQICARYKVSPCTLSRFSITRKRLENRCIGDQVQQEGKLTGHVVTGVDSVGGQHEVEGPSQGLGGSLVHIPCLRAQYTTLEMDQGAEFSQMQVPHVKESSRVLQAF